MGTEGVSSEYLTGSHRIKQSDHMWSQYQEVFYNIVKYSHQDPGLSPASLSLWLVGVSTGLWGSLSLFGLLVEGMVFGMI